MMKKKPKKAHRKKTKSKKMQKKALLLLKAGLILAFLPFGLSHNYRFSMSTAMHENKNEKVLKGVDISVWNDPDLSKIQADFIIVKASGGNHYVSETFQDQIQQALALHKNIGIYHFAKEKNSDSDPAEEARHFYKTVIPYIGKAAFFLDFEVEDENADAWCSSFLKTFYKLSGQKAGLYTYLSMLESQSWDLCANQYPLWLAYYPLNDGLLDHQNPETFLLEWKNAGGWDRVSLWQYGIGKIAGYDKDIDLDFFFGDEKDWQELCRSLYY